MRFRVEGALSDLHATDALYHVDCMTNFMSANSIAAGLEIIEKTPEVFCNKTRKFSRNFANFRARSIDRIPECVE